VKAHYPVIALLASALVSTPAEEKSTISFTVENDSFFGTDRYYTHGFRLQYMHEPNSVPGWTASFLTNFPTLGMEVNRMRIGFALGQEMFTPSNISRRGLIENDRPYGAWLHGSLILRRSGTLAGGFPSMDELELEVGVVGPNAFGEDTQTWWHDFTGYAEPRGWDNQINNEPAIQLYFSRSVQMGFRTEKYWGLDIVPHARVALGNVHVYGEIGTLFRAGFNLPSEYTISPMESFSTHPSYDPPKWSFYMFAGADGRVVGRNIFLDGNTFEDSHSVDKEIFVADLRAGAAVRYGPVEVVGSAVHRTREFELQNKDENFISVTFQYHF
jgi:lipid A 3-O-deacylase